MVYISQETPAQTDRRLRKVLASAVITVLDGPHIFSPLGAPSAAHADAVALVRYDEAWCELRPRRVDETADEAFFVWRIAFPDGGDNSGFVGWLASHLKAELGTGVFVTCGAHADANGVFDYWGAPIALRQPVLDTLSGLAAKAEEP